MPSGYWSEFRRGAYEEWYADIRWPYFMAAAGWFAAAASGPTHNDIAWVERANQVGEVTAWLLFAAFLVSGLFAPKRVTPNA
jgi:hypothetical protein